MRGSRRAVVVEKTCKMWRRPEPSALNVIVEFETDTGVFSRSWSTSWCCPRCLGLVSQDQDSLRQLTRCISQDSL